MAAAADGRTTIVQALLDAKADASLQSKHSGTALMCAEHQKHTATAQVLRQHAKRQMTEAYEAMMHAAADLSPNLSGCRVCIFGLQPTPEP